MNKQKLKITILLLSLLQMGPIFMAPIMGEIIGHFPQYSPSTCQLLMTFPNLMVVFSSIITGKLEPKITKRNLFIFATGAIIISSFGLYSFHTNLMVMFAFAGLLGIGVGVILSLSATVISIYYQGEEQAQVFGLQNSFTNVGGVAMNLICAALAAGAWYRGFLTALIAIPAFIMCFVGMPNEKGIAPSGEKQSLPKVIYAYCAIIFLFLVFFNAFPTNLAVLIGQKELGGTSLSGIASAVLLSGGIIGGITFNILNKKLNEKVIALGYFNLGLGLIIVSIASNIPMLFIGAIIGGCSISLLMSRLSMDVAMNTLPQVTPIAMGLLFACNNCGGFISPLIFGMLKGDVASRYLRFGLAAIVVAIVLFVLFGKKGETTND